MRKYLLPLLFAVISSFIAPATFANITLAPLAGGLSMPVDIANAGDGSGRLFVVEQGGKIRIIQNGFLLATPFLDLTAAPAIVASGGERGLLGLAFHPQYVSNGQFFVYFTATTSAGAGIALGDIVIARFTRSAADPNLADPASYLKILTIPHPGQSNHNGGALRFGPDVFLYAGVGDGGGGGDPSGNGQNLNTLLGKIIRINVTGVATYTNPATNPFFSTAGARPEIWAYGVRNPWRISFDRSNGDFYIGDVGQGNWEEIDRQAAGSLGGVNYGWNICEGNHRYPPQTPVANCVPPANYVAPILEYDHSVGQSITGGYVYRGLSTPDLAGKYVFGDYVQSKLFYNNAPGSFLQIAGLTPQVSTFGEGEAGELYLANYANGTIYSFSSSTDTVPDPLVFFPRNNVAPSTLIVSNFVKLTGLGASTNISIANGEYTLSTIPNSTSCSNSYTTSAGAVATDAYICIRHTSASAASTPKTTTLTVGNSVFTFVSTTQAGPPVFTVTPSLVGSGFISPNTPQQQIQQGQSVHFTITPMPGSTVTVTGTCGGTLNGTNFDTLPVTADCTVIATFSAITYAVTPSAGANGTITPSSVQNISQGATTTFTVTPNPGYSAAVSGTCGGSLVGTTFTTNSIAGNCTVAASFTFIPVAPGAPAIGIAVPGNTQASISFTPPANSGGATISSYTATCNPGGATASGVTSPITVSGLANNSTYTCSVIATNSVGPGTASATVDVTPTSGAPLTLVGVKSRKVHGATTYNLPIATTGPLTVEPRLSGAGHRIVFEFNIPITNSGTAIATDATFAQVGQAFTSASGNDVIVNLAGIADNQRFRLTLNDVNSPGFTTSVLLGFLVGDVNSTQSVNASDISAVKARGNLPLDAANFLFDLNASGAIDAADVSAVKARSGRVIP